MTISDSLAMLRLPRDSKNGLALPTARSRRLQAAHQRGSQTQEQGLLLAAAAGGGRGEPREAFLGGLTQNFLRCVRGPQGEKEAKAMFKRPRAPKTNISPTALCPCPSSDQACNCFGGRTPSPSFIPAHQTAARGEEPCNAPQNRMIFTNSTFL